MPGASTAESGATHCSVREAAQRLRCSDQTVRNLLRRGRLAGNVMRWGRRHVYRVLISSVDDYVRDHGHVSGRSTGQRPLRDRLETLERRLSELEAQQPVQSEPHGDNVNLRFANLRLLHAHEEYGEVLRTVLEADALRSEALTKLERVAANYRAIMEQFHLPAVPPSAE